ncbi:MAG: hypothetical protein IPI35_30280 [Deltaproteobacteria bacterium]|nr:hypothetical protein [Deltaproteobacteria bacterium]
MTEHQGKTWKSAARGAQEADEAEDAPKPTLDAGLTGWLNGLFAGSVKEVRVLPRLTGSLSVLVDDDWGLGANMERILRGVQKDLPPSRRILEINPDHPMVKALGRLQEEGRAEEAAPLAHLLLDQARLVEGDVSDPAGLVQRLRALSELAAKGLGCELPSRREGVKLSRMERPQFETLRDIPAKRISSAVAFVLCGSRASPCAHRSGAS